MHIGTVTTPSYSPTYQRGVVDGKEPAKLFCVLIDRRSNCVCVCVLELRLLSLFQQPSVAPLWSSMPILN